MIIRYKEARRKLIENTLLEIRENLIQNVHEVPILYSEEIREFRIVCSHYQNSFCLYLHINNDSAYERNQYILDFIRTAPFRNDPRNYPHSDFRNLYMVFEDILAVINQPEFSFEKELVSNTLKLEFKKNGQLIL